MLGNLVGGFITILVGVTLVPPVANEVQSARFNSSGDATNVTGASSTILGLTTLFFVLGVTAVGIGLSANALKKSGLM
tara:strand:- start:217 stop:450 length:234 start_codon:yes stop_codon:yes gene_type:complete